MPVTSNRAQRFSTPCARLRQDAAVYRCLMQRDLEQRERRKVRLHVNPDLVRHASVPMLWPLLERQTDVANDRWTGYTKVAATLYELSSLEDCDVAVLPFPWQLAMQDPKFTDLARRESERAGASGKELLVFFHLDDDSVHLDLPNALMFKTSISASTRRPNEFPLPAWADDLLARFAGGRVRARDKPVVPTVGFCGYAPPRGLPLGARAAKEHLRRALVRARISRLLRVSDAMELRSQAVDTLVRSSDLSTNFTFRDSTWVDDDGRVGPYNSSERYHQDYVDNILASDYVLCTRGWGNFSFRLYETMSLGRIPIFVDSDCVLPASDLVDWRALCVWVDAPDVRRLPEIVRSEHDSTTAKDFVRRQLECRRAWEQHLSPHGFFRDLRNMLLERAA
jgi:hypothetical protein